jgi:hypothetical protein
MTTQVIESLLFVQGLRLSGLHDRSRPTLPATDISSCIRPELVTQLASHGAETARIRPT